MAKSGEKRVFYGDFLGNLGRFKGVEWEVIYRVGHSESSYARAILLKSDVILLQLLCSFGMKMSMVENYNRVALVDNPMYPMYIDIGVATLAVLPAEPREGRVPPCES